MDLLEAAKSVVPESLHPNLEYTILHFYEGILMKVSPLWWPTGIQSQV
jgi:hypothetical protein